MAMVNQPTAWRHSPRIAYTFGLLALVGAATVLVVVARHPAFATPQLSTPVPAPEITVFEDVPGHGDTTGSDPFMPDDGLDEPAMVPRVDSNPAAGPAARTPGQHPPEDVRRSLFWSGIFGLTISLAGLGLVATRRRSW
ncbi:hypothetical protein [Salinispora arenicola]|uniref:hypothetical protein n=1 Tax=Salinispora arenicola TaxID=168697 RepID=UPI0003656516|nr:hypothetical protein [Salinispora arenicola]